MGLAACVGFKPQIFLWKLRYLYFHRKKDDGTMEDMAAGQDAELEVQPVDLVVVVGGFNDFLSYPSRNDPI